MTQAQYDTRLAKENNSRILLAVGKSLKRASEDLLQRVGQARENISALGLIWENDNRKFEQALKQAWAEDHGHLIERE